MTNFFLSTVTYRIGGMCLRFSQLYSHSLGLGWL